MARDVSKVFKGRSTGWQKVSLIVAGLAVLVSLALILYGDWGSSVGRAGLFSRLSTAAGFFLFGLSLAGFFAVFAGDLWRNRQTCLRDGSWVRWLWLRELAVVLLNILVYGGIFILAMGALSSLDGADAAHIAVVVVVWALCIAGFAVYRRHRKRHRATYDAIGPVALTAFCAAMAVLGVFMGSDVGTGSVADLVHGPQTELCVLSDVEVNAPTGRYRALSQTILQCDFTTMSGEPVRVEVAEKDVGALEPVVDAAEVGDAVWLTFYPRSHVLVSADSTLGAVR